MSLIVRCPLVSLPSVSDAVSVCHAVNLMLNKRLLWQFHRIANTFTGLYVTYNRLPDQYQQRVALQQALPGIL